MQLDESVEKYTDRFLKLKREATPVADDFLAILFVNSLTSSLQNHVNMAIISLDQEAKNDINLLSSIARKFHTKQQTLPNTVAVKIGRMFSYFAYTRCGLLHFLVYSNLIYTIRKSKLWVILW
ncbi:hypothetical protein G6F37_013893 [Rhizopus arrhizus]|nr:hypothetical protein G6F38_013790 [Rhizopus arrhizus]KAG1135754.1 hypothetical protein G6F37_013893 [Rhizopus arrhizus]